MARNQDQMLAIKANTFGEARCSSVRHSDSHREAIMSRLKNLPTSLLSKLSLFKAILQGFGYVKPKLSSLARRDQTDVYQEDVYR